MDATSVTLIGNITADPEINFTTNGTQVANFTVACTERRYNSATEEWTDGNTSFFRVAAFGIIAENIADSLFRGNRVIVCGKLQQKTYEDKEGNTRTVYDVVASEVGPSLQFAIASLTKRTGNPKPAEDKAPAKTPANRRTARK